MKDQPIAHRVSIFERGSMIGDLDVFLGRHQGTLSCHSMTGKLLLLPKAQFMKVRKVPRSWWQVQVSMGVRRYRIQANDINQADEDLVDNEKRAQHMEEKGDQFLFDLFLSDREHKNGKIKPYLDHDALIEHEK